ncbi:MAG: hypothetical protein F2712_04340 [Actinobacteria bacterium]|uniref:Unannotated protein n=1 Tax=freshwater metagenome TaxID=449393 RepID=A0A6J6UU15_9ZZZZ|nr:hypothetical protein [Actinomycetota bacterium]
MKIIASEYVDLIKYPIHEVGPARKALIDESNLAIKDDGCVVLKGFIKQERISELVAECDRVESQGHRNFTRTNPYFLSDREDLPLTHPLRRFYDRSNAFVPADNFGSESILRAIFDWPAFSPFVKEVLGEENFFPYADPLADVTVNLAEEGGGFPWHFDTNNYTVTLAIQNAERGGDFEYSPMVRSLTEENYEIVEKVLDGDKNLIRTLKLEPGDLQIFKGRYSLHRVAPLAGLRKRYVAIFSYVAEPGMVSSPQRAKELYGRVLPIHLERAGLRADSLID